jgi:hypothetical protein
MQERQLGLRVSFDYDSLKATGTIIHIDSVWVVVQLDEPHASSGWTDTRIGHAHYWSIPYKYVKPLHTLLGNIYT